MFYSNKNAFTICASLKPTLDFTQCDNGLSISCTKEYKIRYRLHSEYTFNVRLC